MTELDERAWRTGTLWIGSRGGACPQAVWILPAHVAIPGDDFMPAGWCGGCETCQGYPAPEVCLACSYGPDGQPKEPVNWPCAVVCWHTRLYARARVMTQPCGSCDGGLPMACTCSTQDPRELIAELVAEVRKLAATINLRRVDSRHTLG